MRDTLIDIKDLSDSKELLLMKPNRLIIVFTCIIFISLLAAVIWMSVSKLDVYVMAAGMVRTNDAVSILRVMNGGKALNVNMADGHVSRGDVLLSFDQQPLYIQIDKNHRDIDELNKGIELLKLYRLSIEELENYLDGNETDKGRAYSLKVEGFLLERETALTQVAENEKDNELLRKSAEIKLSNARDSLAGLLSEQTWLERYRASIENGRDMISMESGNNTNKSNYASMYQKYNVGLDTLKMEKLQIQENLDKVTHLYEMGDAARKELDEAINALKEAEGRIESYRRTELSAADSKAVEMDSRISDARKLIKTAEQEVKLYSESKTSPLMQVEQAKINLLSQIDSEIQQKNESIDTLNSENESIIAQISDTRIIAPIDGILSLNNPINEGDIIAPGTEIGVITPPDSDSFKISMQVSNKDIAGVKINQPVKIKFLALPYQEYGMVDGIVSKISADSRVNSQTGESYYTVEAVLDNKPIKSYRGADESIRVGMAVEGRLISGRKTVLRWLIEKLNFA